MSWWAYEDFPEMRMDKSVSDVRKASLSLNGCTFRIGLRTKLF